ncbi:hypothetical protein BCR34DRAFT_84370 [Clohesyomyces aquaticus]|uniref:Uncharacterized protein n=1 Tax=Clohesyomyces aquaticus TaxID=1231657 RepID=A0A1Y1YXJ0_9PLEO|nr:hypothetical protein BCR34DRAFT_84370 [Clohesyomyces aquaticus]
MEPASLFAALNTALRFTELLVRLIEVGSENEVFVRTIEIVRVDLNEVLRLLSIESVRRKLTAVPGKFQWIKSAIESTRLALTDIAQWVERARVDQQATGSVKLETRLRWVFNDHEKLSNRQVELQTCHRQLSNVLTFLNPLEEIPAGADPPKYYDAVFFDELVAARPNREGMTKGGKRGSTTREPKAEELLRLTRPPTETDTQANIALMNLGAAPPRREDEPITNTTSAGYTTQQTVIEPRRDPRRSSILSHTIPPAISPPPTYASIARTSRDGLNLAGDAGSETPNECNSVNPSERQSSSSNDFQPWSPPPEKRRHEAFREEEPQKYVPELAGDTLALSGTNAMGPVNPYELWAGPISPSQPSKASTSGSLSRDIDAIAEMLGDMSFPVELPTNDPGPPPGYPRPGARRVVSELSAQVPSRRPVAPKSFHNSFPSAHELPVTDTSDRASYSYHSPSELPNSLRHSSTTSIDSQRSGVEMSSESSRAQPSRYRQRSSASSQYPSTSAQSLTSSPSQSSIFTSPSPFPPSSPRASTLFGIEERAVSPLAEPANPEPTLSPPRRPETAAGARMRSQRAFMDMLGSIDQT